MIIVDSFKQNTPQWDALRCGRVSASNFDKVQAGGNGATRLGYMYKKAAEIITNIPEKDDYKNEYMEHGSRTEDQARAFYELETGADVRQVAGVLLDSQRVMVSPDGLQLEKGGGLEIKCLKTTTHIKIIKSGKMPPGYRHQVYGQMWICELDWVDFVSFDPRMPPEHRMFIDRITRDEKEIKILVDKVLAFVDDLDAMVKAIKSAGMRVEH